MGRLVHRASDTAWWAIRRDAPARQKITYDLLARDFLDKFLPRLSHPAPTRFDLERSPFPTALTFRS